MDLTPTDVEQKAFTQALRGYQMDEVDDFLDEIVTSIRSYDARLRESQDRIQTLENEAVSRGGDESTISRAILVAQRTADALLEEARLEAERIRKEAVAEIERLSGEREVERKNLRDEIQGMRDKVSDLRATLAMLTAEIEGQIGGMDGEIAGADEFLAIETQVTDDDDQESDRTSPSSTPTPQTAESGVAGNEGSGDPAEGPAYDIDLSEGEKDNDMEKESAGRRVSARPWERG